MKAIIAPPALETRKGITKPKSLNEAENSLQEQFGDNRLLNFFQNRSDEDCQQIINQMNATVSYFVGDAEPSDDLTMLCLKIS